MTTFIVNTADAARLTGAIDVYFSVTLQDPLEVKRIAAKSGQKRPRWYAQSARIIGALWLDVDVATGTHQKEGLFPDEAAALKFLYETLAIPPSFVVRTGGGFHAYWVFDVPIIVEDPFKAVALPQAWQDYCRHEAKQIGFDLDATHDLARMLRPVGTLNGKYALTDGGELRDNRVSCIARDTVPSIDCAPTFTPEDFDVLIGQRREQIEYSSSAESGVPFIVGPVGGLDVVCTPFKAMPRIVQALCENSVDFAAVWNREVTHLPSQSEYDMSVASWLAKFDVSDQTIIDALVIHRRNAGLEAKPREDYYARTIAKARKDGVSDPTQYAKRRAQEERGAENRLKEDANTTDGGRAVPSRIADVNRLIGGQVEIIKVIRYDGDPPTYTLKTDCGSVTIGEVRNITNPTSMLNLIASSTGKIITRYKLKTWDPIAQAILAASEHVDLGEASHPSIKLAEEIEAYLDETRAGKDRDDCLSARLPWRDEVSGEVWIHLPSLVRWLCGPGQRATAVEVARRLRELGSEPRTFNFTRKTGGGAGTRTTASYWRASGLMRIGTNGTTPQEVLGDSGGIEGPL